MVRQIIAVLATLIVSAAAASDVDMGVQDTFGYAQPFVYQDGEPMAYIEATDVKSSDGLLARGLNTLRIRVDGDSPFGIIVSGTAVLPGHTELISIEIATPGFFKIPIYPSEDGVEGNTSWKVGLDVVQAYWCAEGYELSDTICESIDIKPAIWSCELFVDYTLDGDQCSRVITIDKTSNCEEGDSYLDTSNECEKLTTTAATYRCPAGYDEDVPCTETYTCPSGYTLSGTTCSKTGSFSSQYLFSITTRLEWPDGSGFYLSNPDFYGCETGLTISSIATDSVDCESDFGDDSDTGCREVIHLTNGYYSDDVSNRSSTTCYGTKTEPASMACEANTGDNSDSCSKATSDSRYVKETCPSGYSRDSYASPPRDQCHEIGALVCPEGYHSGYVGDCDVDTVVLNIDTPCPDGWLERSTGISTHSCKAADALNVPASCESGWTLNEYHEACLKDSGSVPLEISCTVDDYIYSASKGTCVKTLTADKEHYCDDGGIAVEGDSTTCETVTVYAAIPSSCLEGYVLDEQSNECVANTSYDAVINCGSLNYVSSSGQCEGWRRYTFANHSEDRYNCLDGRAFPSGESTLTQENYGGQSCYETENISCPSGYYPQPEGGCRAGLAPANADGTCPAAYPFLTSGGRYCQEKEVDRVAPTCSSGFALEEGDAMTAEYCISTSAAIQPSRECHTTPWAYNADSNLCEYWKETSPTYTCPSGGTLEGQSCSQVDRQAPISTGCPGDMLESGDQCLYTVTEPALRTCTDEDYLYHAGEDHCEKVLQAPILPLN